MAPPAPLPFFDELLRQLQEADGLTVLAEGLGVLRLAAALLQQHAAQRGGLVLVLGATPPPALTRVCTAAPKRVSV